ncbi:erythrocyte band 7 integral membrane protein [Sarotherodon galilaeus]
MGEAVIGRLLQLQNATVAAANIANTDAVTQLLAQTNPRIILGTKNLAEALSGHEQIVQCMQKVSRSCSFTTTLHICIEISRACHLQHL